MQLPIRVAPSLLASDFTNLKSELARAEAAGADWHHVDVMDGHFVPNLSIGPPVVQSIKKVSGIPLDVHLMIENPGEWADIYAKAGADILSFHYEAAADNFEATLNQFKDTGCKVGVALNPPCGVEVLKPYLKDIDMVLIMSVNAGFGGQSFMPEVLSKVSQLREWGYDGDIQIDGGISDKTIGPCLAAGANVFVAGSYLYGADSMPEALQELHNKVEYKDGISHS
ncbi:MAG: ribulose-phosphate 3-epimerase [Planctomycetota bacterium]|jgi:ribulose-phosphate 3-epimerase|nr:ribulose-phosphate 3-epimerase [Planctomycetota bacterium]